MESRPPYDVVVVGGGTAGVAAAVSAARVGARTALLERSGFLGGTMTGVSLGSLCGFYRMDGPGDPRLIAGSIPREIVERLRRAGGAPPEPVPLLETASVPYDLFSLKRVLDELVDEAGVDVFAHTWTSAPMLSDHQVDGVIAHAPSGSFELPAKAVVDASGDAVVAAAAGADCDVRPEPQRPTAMFRFGGVDTEVAMRLSRADLRAALEEASEAGFALPRTAGGMFSVRPGVVHVNITRVPVDAQQSALRPEVLGRLEREGRRQVALYEAAFRDHVPGFAEAFVIDSGTHLGIRESRRLVGQHILTGEEVRAGARFADAIGCSAWPIERHGTGTSVTWEWLPTGMHYQIPLRVLLPSAIDGVIIAGRSLSADPVAHASARVAAPCMAMGEAAGLTAAHSADTGVPTRSVGAATVRGELRRRGAYLGDD